ncbi:OmpA family protein [Sulfurovum sp. bin170]|uniref:OmpA family protein n=1 Tax=Sulfurovum sp. bin170 TaxID=2695268 RepID=UPI0013E0ADAA|nr:OmpA family protein [Sulfurovum sp. bin170]NEW60656.1 OmpA family protein [Sulfurovum sp. bin170]
MKTVIFFGLFTATTLLYASIENEIGISVGTTALQNEDGNKFKNYGASATYQMNRFVVSPRFDIDYVKVSDYDGVGSLWKASVNGVYEYENQTEFTPYGLVGLGYEKVSSEVKGKFESHPFVQGGVGVGYKLKNGYKAKVEGKMLQIIGGEDENHEMMLGVGMSFPVGGQEKRRRIVRRRASSKPVIIRQQVPVYINSRTCSKKIAGADRDRDGITDRADQCPNTPCDFSVDRFGCPVKATLRINFATASAMIRPNSIPKIHNFANFLLRNRGSMVKIVGHTDSVGKSAYNFALSKRRAKSVADRLIMLGVSPARVSFDGRGESQPIAHNGTVNGKAQNRRIEAILSYPNRRRGR